MPAYSLTDFLEDGAIVLEDVPSRKYPKGHAYRFESPTFEVGLWLKNLIELGQRAQLGVAASEADLNGLLLNDKEERDLYRRVMGDTLDAMGKDGVSWAHVQQVFKLLLRKWGAGIEIDQALAEAAGEAVPGPNRAARRASAKSSSPKAGTKSSRASSGTRARTTGPASTRSSATSATRGARAAG